jgi:hypothetical protein
MSLFALFVVMVVLLFCVIMSLVFVIMSFMRLYGSVVSRTSRSYSESES